MKKTLGGERLGSGKRMDVELHGFERSTHDLSYIWRSTMAAGTLVPFLREIALPGDTFDIHLNCDIKTHPTVGPLFGSYKVQLDIFTVPFRLYNSATHNNRLGIGMRMADIKLPKLTLQGPGLVSTSDTIVRDIDNYQISPSCILSYLGIRGLGTAIGGESLAVRSFNAVSFLAYWDIFKNYYANKQEENAYVISGEIISGLRNISSIKIPATSSFGIPQNSGNTTTPFILDITPGDSIEINWTGASSPAPAVASIILVDSYGRTFNLRDLSSNITQTGANQLTGSYNTANYDYYNDGIIPVRYWRYAEPQELSTLPPTLYEFPLTNIDLMRDEILQTPYNVEFFVNTPDIAPYNRVLRVGSSGEGVMQAATQLGQEGLAVKTYQSDLFNNWLSTEWIDGVGGINEITAIDTSSGSFNIDTLNLSKKVYDMLNRIAVSGGSFNDWVEAVYDEEMFHRPESPVYMGGLIKELVFQEVVSNSATAEDGGQPLGTLAGKGVMGQKHKGGTVVIKVTEPSYIMGIISLTPRVDYSQGNKWDVNLQTWDDFHKPSLDQIGFQELITEQMAYWSSNLRSIPGLYWETQSAGKQPAWINYMTNVNEVRGNFAIEGNEMFMTLNRRFEPEWNGTDTMSIKDLTTYIDPEKFNHIFAQTSRDAQNFWAQISIDMIARRKMSAKVMPNL